MFSELDHIAIAVPDTDDALCIWRDRFGFAVIHREVVNDGAVSLTHLDLGNVQLQLVQPLTADHLLHDWLRERGSGLHHLCLRVDNLDGAAVDAARAGLPTKGSKPHQGIQGRRALFLDEKATDGVFVELTGA